MAYTFTRASVIPAVTGLLLAGLLAATPPTPPKIFAAGAAPALPPPEHLNRGLVAMRTTRDAGLAMPNLILPSVQINIRAGDLPPADSNGVSYLRIPLNAL